MKKKLKGQFFLFEIPKLIIWISNGLISYLERYVGWKNIVGSGDGIEELKC
jgi:hypothetical protein